MECNNFWMRLLPRVPVLAALLCLPVVQPQSSSPERVTVGQPGKIAGKRNAALQTKIPISVLDGFHVNSNSPGDEYLIPLKLTWTELGALEGGQVSYPQAQKYKVGDEMLNVFTGKFELTANFKVSANAPAGPGAAAGKLHYQACNDRACFPPKTIDVSVPYQVQ